MKELRLLKANEIDVRVGSINEKGATLLLYKDARVDMNILDESDVKWKRSHELINGNLFCTISIWDDEIKDWITRQDVGTESNTEKEKGQASDAFKRAGFNFGIGRELYTAPFVWVSSDAYKGFERNGKFGTYDKFKVASIGYDENKEINALVVYNEKTDGTVFTLGEKPKSTSVIRNRTEEVKGGTEKMGDSDVLTRAKKAINTELINQNYITNDSKVAFIKQVLKKDTIDSIDDAELVDDALADQVLEPGINQDGTYNK